MLRSVLCSIQALALRRRQSEQVDEDPLVWTNLRFIKWARNIDLGEYADNLKGKSNQTDRISEENHAE